MLQFQIALTVIVCEDPEYGWSTPFQFFEVISMTRYKNLLRYLSRPEVQEKVSSKLRTYF